MPAPDPAPSKDEMLSISFAGRSFFLDGREGADLVARQMAQGSYEAPLPMLLMAAVSRTSGMFLDIGANNGLYSILACKTRDDVKVAAFEPYPPVANVLRGNLVANKIEHQVTVYPFALSESVGSASMYIPDPRHGLLETSASLEVSFKPHAASMLVEKKCLDDIDFADSISVIKIDIEGHEAECLKGAKRCLMDHRPIIFAEMLPGAAEKFHDLSEMFANLDYVLFRLRPEYVIACRLIKYDSLSWNYGMIPREKIHIFMECCSFHGLEIFKLYSDEWIDN